jgi:DNA repair exonuclease SbcCD ATPase subunit
MRIIRLQINNVLNLRAIDVRPAKNVNKVSGKNGAGKSNFLETIRFSLLGKRAMPAKPLKNGAKKGDIVVELDDYIINVKITANGEYWNVTDKEGKPVASPQSLLKDIVGPVSFDPLALLDDDPKKLRQVLLELVGVKLDDFDTKIKKVRDDRTLVGRAVDRSKALCDACVHHEDAPKEEVSVAELSLKLQDANDLNNEIKTVGSDIDAARVRIKNCEGKIEELKQLILTEEEDIKKAVKYLKTFTIVDTAAITAQINNAEQTNKKVRDNKAYIERKKQAAKDSEEYEALSEQIEELETAKSEALQKAKMPIPGLGVDDNGVTYTDTQYGTRPLSQVNKAKRIEIGTAIHIAMNPNLRVMFVDGNSFDEATEKAIESAVKDADYQLFEEVVDDTTETGIMLVDGTLKE